MTSTAPAKNEQPNIFHILKPYRGAISALVIITIAINALGLAIPKMMSHAVDAFLRGDFVLHTVVLSFCVVAAVIFVFTYVQGVLQTKVSERAARDMRNDLIAKISRQSYTYIQKTTPAQLLTNLTADIDAIKMFVAQAVVSVISSALTILGSAIVLISINGKLGLAVLVVIPLIAATFFGVLSRVRVLFTSAQKSIDWLNKVINESILGAALIRVLNAQHIEHAKFTHANEQATAIGMRILGMFAGLIPIIGFLANTATLIILVLGGHYVINNSMTLGDFAAFSSYLALMIFPIFVIGFMGNVIARATASYARIAEVLNAEEPAAYGNVTTPLKGEVTLRNITLTYGEASILKDISLTLKPGTKTAIIGPTAAGKTQLLYVLTGLLPPTSGVVEYDGIAAQEYDSVTLRRQIGFVFQDSIMFNLSLRENIAFRAEVHDEDLEKAIEAAELGDFIATLPHGLDTLVSERGTTLSGGQKQRVMLARALALNPKVLLLDDFTARVDVQTEKKILSNVAAAYPGMTLLSVTQKIASVTDYDQIIVLMEGEVLATGTHDDLLHRSPEYAQIANSQQSTSAYDVRPE